MEFNRMSLVENYPKIDLKKEAMAILAAFEELVDNHYSFLSLHKVTNKLPWEVTPFFGFNLGNIHPDFNIKQNSLFVWVYKKLEDPLIDLTTLKEEEIHSADFRESIDNALDFLIQLLSNYYANAECTIGAVSSRSRLLLNSTLAGKVIVSQ